MQGLNVVLVSLFEDSSFMVLLLNGPSLAPLMYLSLDLPYSTVFAPEIQMVPKLLIFPEGCENWDFPHPQEMECCRTWCHGVFDSGSNMLFLLGLHIMFYHNCWSVENTIIYPRLNQLHGVETSSFGKWACQVLHWFTAGAT